MQEIDKPYTPTRFHIETPEYDRLYKEILDKYVSEFQDAFEHARDKQYFISTYSNKVSENRQKLSMSSGALGQEISAIKCQYELSDKYSFNDLVKQLCEKTNKNYEETVKVMAEIMVLDELYFIVTRSRPPVETTSPGEIAVINSLKNAIQSDTNKKEVGKTTFTIRKNKSEEIYDELKDFFLEHEHLSLKNLLSNIPIKNKITFRGNSNCLVEFFRRLKYHNYIVETYTNINSWICNNFLFINQITKQPTDFKCGSVKSVLSGSTLPKKTNRIGKFDWLPFLTSQQLKKKDS